MIQMDDQFEYVHRYMIHSPYTDGTFRGAEKSMNLLFDTEEEAQQKLSELMPDEEDRSYYRVMPVIVVVPHIRKPLNAVGDAYHASFVPKPLAIFPAPITVQEIETLRSMPDFEFTFYTVRKDLGPDPFAGHSPFHDDVVAAFTELYHLEQYVRRRVEDILRRHTLTQHFSSGSVELWKNPIVPK